MGDFVGDKECTTHHYACDCREAKIQRLIKAARKYRLIPHNIDQRIADEKEFSEALHEVEAMYKEKTISQEELQAIWDLLAVIHRDGGHYTGKHGLLKSCKDAEKVVTRLRETIELERRKETK